MTLILRPGPDGDISKEDREALAAAAREGRVIVFPTDTVYGIGTSGLVREGVRRIYAIKGRHHAKPLPIFVHSTEEARRWARWTPGAESLAEKHWPGALTIVLRPTEEGRKLLSGGAQTLALRVPDQPVVLDLLKASGVPWAVTSANASGRPSLREVCRRSRGGLVSWAIAGQLDPSAARIVVRAADATLDRRVGAIGGHEDAAVSGSAPGQAGAFGG